MKGSTAKSLGSSPSPWVLFSIFLAANLLLSYFPLPLENKLWIGLLGLLLPFAIALGKGRQPSAAKDFFAKALLPSPPAWAWLAVAGLGIAARFFQLTSLSTWPMPDEGVQSFLAFTLGREEPSKFFLLDTQVPVGGFWVLSALYRVFPPSLFSLWLIPALLSLGVLLLFYRGARAFFPPPFTFVLFSLAALNFGFLYTGRFFMSTAVVLVWMALAWAALSLWWKAFDSPAGKFWDWGLGIVLGSGFFIAIPWLAVAIPALLAAGGRAKGKRQVPGVWIPFLAGAFLYTFLFFKYGGAGHIQRLWAFGPGTDWTKQLHDSLCNLSALFWGTDVRIGYGPLWGGILNPLAASCFFLGLAEWARRWKNPLCLWLALSFLLGLAPGLLSKDYDFFRDLGVLASLLILTAWGCQSLVSSLAPSARAVALALLLGFSGGLDFYHLAGPYHQSWGTPGPSWEGLKSSELYSAWQVLGQVGRERGPGFVLEDLRPAVTDRTLQVAVHPFDAAWNSSISPAQASWAALIVNAHYKPFLQQKFPEGEWHWLGQEDIWKQPMMLAVIPVTSSNAGLLRQWVEGDRLFHPLAFRISNVLSDENQEDVVKSLLELEPALSKDPFLETCLWEKIAFHRMSLHDGPGALEAVRQALQKGLPLAHLFNLEGVLLARMGRTTEARSAFQKALRAPLNLTPAADNLKALKP